MHARPWVKLTHRISATIIIVFVIVHLANHIAGFWGVAAHQAFMDGARRIYRSPPAEVLLLAAVVVQVMTGLAQVQAGWGKRRSAWDRLQAASGLYLALYLVNHTLSVLAARVFYHLDSDFYLAAAVLTIEPLPVFFAPYYALGIFAVFVHVACAIRAHLPAPLGGRIATGVVASAALAAPAIVAVFMGAFYEIELPPAYRAMVERFL